MKLFVGAVVRLCCSSAYLSVKVYQPGTSPKMFVWGQNFSAGIVCDCMFSYVTVCTRMLLVCIWCNGFSHNRISVREVLASSPRARYQSG